MPESATSEASHHGVAHADVNLVLLVWIHDGSSLSVMQPRIVDGLDRRTFAVGVLLAIAAVTAQSQTDHNA